MDYDTKNHAKFLMPYHIIFVCKYREAEDLVDEAPDLYKCELYEGYFSQ